MHTSNRKRLNATARQSSGDIRDSCNAGFTLIELLVVMAIISILASMVLPTLGRGKQKARMTQCVNNLHQIAGTFAMYMHDNVDRTPAEWPFLGGRDGRADLAARSPAFWGFAGRPLSPYLKQSEVFRCMEDRGTWEAFASPTGGVSLKPTAWEVAGCSYFYNGRPYPWTRRPVERVNAGMPIGWFPTPALFIVTYEPPATPFLSRDQHTGDTFNFYQHWHYASGTTDYFEDPHHPSLSSDPFKFISPIHFLDGHVAVHDFTATIHADPHYGCEPTKDWIWYKPSPETNSPAVAR